MRIAVLVLSLAATASAQDFMGKKVVDLTYPFNDKTIYWPTAKGFVHEEVAWGMTKAGFWYTSANYSASEHGGTHLDAPIHFAEGAWSNEQIPVDRLMGAVFVLDVSAACAKDPDYQARPEDFAAWEKKNGKLPKDAILLLRTGWGSRWPDRKAYLGDDTPGDASKLHFPGFGKALAELLVKERGVKGVGLDTASLDPGNSKDYPAHQVFNKANVYGLENVAHLDRLPEKGAYLIALPMKIEKGTGGPVRIVALVE